MVIAMSTPTRVRAATRAKLMMALVFIALAFASTAYAQTNCPAANPNDGILDSDAIQNCIDTQGTVILVPGNPGYLIGSGSFNHREGTLRFRPPAQLLTSVGGKARLLAHPQFWGPMIDVQGNDYWEISELIVDGNRTNRTRTSTCFSGGGINGSNVWTSGTGYTFHHVDTINAMCGSGLEAAGNNFEIYSVYAANNGSEAPSGPWADGITLTQCYGGNVHDNAAVNNTDVGLVIFQGANCTVRYNEIVNNSRYAFAGLKVGEANGTLPGSVIRDNTVSSGYNLLSFGIMVGHHPWDSSSTFGDVGEVSYNSSTGAVVNLAVDGISAGTVNNNSFSGAQGNRGYHCSTSVNYTAGHWGSAFVQGGWNLFWQYDGVSCGPA